MTMWKQIDSIGWTWLNIITTLFIVILTFEWLSEITISPLAVLGLIIFGWIMFRSLEEISYEDRDLCIGEVEYGMSALFGFLIQIPLIFMVAGYQWALTGDMIWLYLPVWVITYWIIQLAYGIAVSFRCVSE